MDPQIPVTVSVITYNSSKFVLETLESVKAQTYQPLILHICDDCSTDDTVKICKNWIEENKDRFIKTKVICSEFNTGISANLNRAMDACETEWFKGIAGDDVLKPECLREYMQYVQRNPDVVVLFSRVEAFGVNRERVSAFSSFFDYGFFDLTQAEQLERLIMKGNCIPAATVLFNAKYMHEKNIKADERIPMLEDHPLWINFLNNGVRFNFVDKILVQYRVGEGGLSSGASRSIELQHSYRLFLLYYIFPVLFSRDPSDALDQIAIELNALMQDFRVLYNSPSYRYGRLLLSPIKWIKKHILAFVIKK